MSCFGLFGSPGKYKPKKSYRVHKIPTMVLGCFGHLIPRQLCTWTLRVINSPWILYAIRAWGRGAKANPISPEKAQWRLIVLVGLPWLLLPRLYWLMGLDLGAGAIEAQDLRGPGLQVGPRLFEATLAAADLRAKCVRSAAYASVAFHTYICVYIYM